MSNDTPTLYPQEAQRFNQPNAVITRTGTRHVQVNITAEMKAVLERYGYTVTWLPAIGKQVAA